MGMAASQARLLSITARIHDVEYQAQSIQNAKIQLANNEDQAYREYNAALEATMLTIKAIDINSGEKSTIPANFNNLCSRNRVTPATDNGYYAIRNKEGKLIVEDEIFEAYEDFKGYGLDDPYQFALFMMSDDYLESISHLVDGDLTEKLLKAEEGVYKSLSEQEADSHQRLIGLHEDLEKLVGEDAVSIYDTNNLPQDKIEDYEKKLLEYKKELYKNSEDINTKLYNNENETPNYEEGDFNTSLFNYYVSIYNQIEFCGGCVSIDSYDGFAGDAANDTDWLQTMVQAGQFSIELIKEDKRNGKIDLEATSPSSDSCLSYTQTSSIDNQAVAKAEAKYEHTLKQINKKDQKFDLDLSKLETERTALTTEYDSIKKVIEDNIDRTFGIFS